MTMNERIEEELKEIKKSEMIVKLQLFKKHDNHKFYKIR